jgi:adenine-specific DNA glycosylase
MVFARIEHEGALLLEQRPLDGLWPGLWEMPSASGVGAKQKLAQRLGHPLGPLLARVSHELTHRHIVARVYQAAAPKLPEQRWWPKPLAAPLSSLARKTIVASGR